MEPGSSSFALLARPGASRAIEILLAFGDSLSTGRSQVTMRKKPLERNSSNKPVLSRPFLNGWPRGHSDNAFIVSLNRCPLPIVLLQEKNPPAEGGGSATSSTRIGAGL